MPRLVFSFYFFLSFFLIVGRIVDGFAFVFFFLQLGRGEGGKGGWMDRWMEGSIMPYHIRVRLLD